MVALDKGFIQVTSAQREIRRTHHRLCKTTDLVAPPYDKIDRLPGDDYGIGSVGLE